MQTYFLLKLDISLAAAIAMFILAANIPYSWIL